MLGITALGLSGGWKAIWWHRLSGSSLINPKATGEKRKSLTRNCLPGSGAVGGYS